MLKFHFPCHLLIFFSEKEEAEKQQQEKAEEEKEKEENKEEVEEEDEEEEEEEVDEEEKQEEEEKKQAGRGTRKQVGSGSWVFWWEFGLLATMKAGWHMVQEQEMEQATRMKNRQGPSYCRCWTQVRNETEKKRAKNKKKQRKGEDFEQAHYLICPFCAEFTDM